MGRPKVGEILVRSGLIDEMQLRAALGDQRNWGQPLGATLVKMGIIEERDLVRALAQQLQLPVVELEGKRVQTEVLDLVPADFAEKHLCVPLFVKRQGGANVLHVGMDDPCDVEVLDDLGFRTGMKVQPVLVSPSELCEAIDRFYRRGGDSFAGGRSIDLGSSEGDAENAPIVHESSFRDLSNPAGSRTLERADDAAPAVPAPAQGGDDTTSRTILRALCHLLIENGVIDRDELSALVKQLHEKEATRG